MSTHIQPINNIYYTHKTFGREGWLFLPGLLLHLLEVLELLQQLLHLDFILLSLEFIQFCLCKIKGSEMERSRVGRNVKGYLEDEGASLRAREEYRNHLSWETGENA